MNTLHYSMVGSTISELVPTLCFNNRFLPKCYTEIEPFIDSLDIESKDSKKSFVSESNLQCAKKYLDLRHSIDPDIKNEKFQNAFAVTDYLYRTNEKYSVVEVKWGHKEKPYNIERNHAGDIYIKYEDGTVTGISIKTGTETSNEPRLNTYLKSTLLKQDWIAAAPDSIYQLKNELWDKVYSNIPQLPDSVTKENYFSLIGKCNRLLPNKSLIDTLIKFNESDPESFNTMYGEMLSICRNKMIDLINVNFHATKNWITNEFRIKNLYNQHVPLVLLKAINTKYKIDSDCLSNHINGAESIVAYKDDNSIQEWYIELSSNKDYTQKLFMTTRSDQGFRQDKPKGKLGAFLNLKLQYRGYECQGISVT